MCIRDRYYDTEKQSNDDLDVAKNNLKKEQEKVDNLINNFGSENLKKNLHTIREIKNNIDETLWVEGFLQEFLNTIHYYSGEYNSVEDFIEFHNKKNEILDSNEYELEMGINQNPFVIKLERSDEAKKPNSREVCLYDYIKLPLTIRRPKIGDAFYPYGMKGKKKLSKFFKDKKMSIFAKQNQWVLLKGDDILWIIGQRADNRFIKTKGKCLKIS